MYCRFLAAVRPEMSDDHQRNYLFRIATNLLRDHWRRSGVEPLFLGGSEHALQLAGDDRTAEEVQVRQDVHRVLDRMKPRERAMLWLAYVLGASHKEIAEVLGLRAPSVRLLLFRARRKFADLIRYPEREKAKAPHRAPKGVVP